MPISKTRNAERMRSFRMHTGTRPNPLPDYLVHPNVYLLAHIKAYPQGFNADGTYRADYNDMLDPYINPLVRAS